MASRLDWFAQRVPLKRCFILHNSRVPFPICTQQRGFSEKKLTKCSMRDLPYDHITAAKKSQGRSSSGGRFLLVDGSAVIFRAFYKLMAKVSHNMISELHSEADWVLTVFTAFTTILELFDLNPSHCAVVFDYKGGTRASGLTFRHTLFPEYKKNRPPTPDTVLQGLDHLRPALVAMGLKVVEVPGVEADDVIATLTATATAANMKVRIVSPDKDFFQVLNPAVRLLRFMSKGAGMDSFGMEEFSERFGSLTPEQFVDVLSLVGDTCDNIPGIPGIGEKTAIKLITQYGSVENLLQQRETVGVKRAVKGLQADTGGALLSKRLVALRADLPPYMIPFTLNDFSWKKPHDGGENLFQLLTALSSFIDSNVHLELQERIFDLWRKLEANA